MWTGAFCLGYCSVITTFICQCGKYDGHQSKWAFSISSVRRCSQLWSYPGSCLLPCLARRSSRLFFPLFFFLPRKTGGRHDKMRFHNETRGAVIWTSGAEPRQTDSFISLRACTCCHLARNLPDKHKSTQSHHNSASARRQIRVRWRKNTQSPAAFDPPRHIHTGMQKSRFRWNYRRRANYTAAAGPRRRRLQKLEVVAFSNNSIQTSTEGSQLFCQLSFFLILVWKNSTN